MPDPKPQSRLHRVLIVLVCIAAIPMVPYLIILVAIAEELVFGTRFISRIMKHTETIDFFRWLLTAVF